MKTFLASFIGTVIGVLVINVLTAYREAQQAQEISAAWNKAWTNIREHHLRPEMKS